MISQLLVIALLFSLAIPCSAALISPLLLRQNYKIDATGCTISIPSSWKLENTGSGIEFIPSSGDAVPMGYCYMDLWKDLTPSDKLKTDRTKYNNDYISKVDIAELLGVSSQDVCFVTLGSHEYFQVTTTTSSGLYFYNNKTTMISLIHVENGYLHLYQFEADTAHSLYSSFETMVASSTYASSASGKGAVGTVKTITLDPFTSAASGNSSATSNTPSTTSNNSSDIYTEAKDAYDDGDYSTAKKLFDSVSSYKDAQKYLRLIRIRDYGSNTGIGCVYNFSKALTDSQKKEIDKAAEDFYFADTAQVLLCNTDVACYYIGAHNSLSGNWITASNAPTYAYFKLHKDSSGGYYYTRSSNLSNATSDCVSIIDGDVRISITSSNTLVFHIDLTAPGCMDIYSYETCKSFALYRS